MAEETDHRDEKTERITFEPLEYELKEYCEKHLPDMDPFINVSPHTYTMISQFRDFCQSFLDFPHCQPSDIWVSSHPKAGTTWTQELVWCLVRGLDHPLGALPLMRRFPFFEWDSLITPPLAEALEALPGDNVERRGEQWGILARQEAPRLIKTHLHRELMPTGVRLRRSKIIHVVRDPRDVCVSLYHHSIKFLGYTGDFGHFVDLFLSSAYQFGPYWSNVLSFWNKRHTDNILIVSYEELHKDLKGAIHRVAEYLGQTVTEDQVQSLEDHLSFSSMRTNPATNNEDINEGIAPPSDVKFMRKGIVGDHKNVMSAEQLRRFQAWTDLWLKDSDFPFYRH